MNMANWAYLNNIEQVHYKKQDIELHEVKKFLKLIGDFAPTGFFFPITLFLLDYTKRQYHAFKTPHEGLMGFNAEDFLNEGLDFTIEKYHKDDFALLNSQIFKATLDLLRDIPHAERNDLVFTYTYRFKTKGKAINSAFQKCKYITAKDTGQPLYSYGMVTDITPVKHDTSMILLVDKYSHANNSIVCQNLITQYFYPDPEIAVLTKREREILLWMTEGLGSKQIADQLNISENTIANHRKNMLKKTNSVTVAQLVKYAFENHII